MTRFSPKHHEHVKELPQLSILALARPPQQCPLLADSGPSARTEPPILVISSGARADADEEREKDGHVETHDLLKVLFLGILSILDI